MSDSARLRVVILARTLRRRRARDWQYLPVGEAKELAKALSELVGLCPAGVGRRWGT